MIPPPRQQQGRTFYSGAVRAVIKYAFTFFAIKKLSPNPLPPKAIIDRGWGKKPSKKRGGRGWRRKLPFTRNLEFVGKMGGRDYANVPDGTDLA